MKKVLRIAFAGIVVALIAISFPCCKKSKTTASSGPDPVLISIGNNIILPAYTTLAGNVNSLDSAITDFNTAPDASKLASLQLIFKNTYISWQSASEYDGFGPAIANQMTLGNLNLFPCLATKIDSNISVGSYNINAFGNSAAKGFPALDYLLFGAGSNTLASYTTDAHAANRKQYIAAVSADIKGEVSAVLKEWQPTGGNYINTFNTGTGNSISSSLGLLINSLDQDFEILKNDRLGIPLGKQAMGASSAILPNEVEAYYSGISAQLALAQLKAVQNIYVGTTDAQGNTLGLANYLVKANAKFNGGPLNDTIKAHLAYAVNALQAIPDPLSATIQTNPTPSNALYVEIQRLVVLLKTDMPSSIGVLITYGDNDGD